MKCENCKHPLSAHYPDGCFASMWGGSCEKRCRIFVAPAKVAARCESGWTGDRCTYPLFHDGPHSNEGRRDEVDPEVAYSAYGYDGNE